MLLNEGCGISIKTGSEDCIMYIWASYVHVGILFLDTNIMSQFHTYMHYMYMGILLTLGLPFL